MIKFLMFLSLLYTGNEFARVGDIRGDAQILRYGEEEAEWLTINNIVGEGDQLLTYRDSYVELEFSDGSVLSMGEDTRVYVERIEGDRAYFTLEKGSLRVFARSRVFGIFTDTKSVYVTENSIVRVDAREDYFALRVIKGKVKVDGKSFYAGSTIIEDRGRVYCGSSYDYDDFDRWAEGKEREFYIIERIEFIPVPYYAGVYHLKRHGRWVYIRPYGWVWVPRVPRGWRPYYYGHWVFRLGIGWVWVSYEPWGWIPYHYGCWTYVSGYGWVWIPGETFAGAWVEWYYGPDWVGWAPVDYYGRPIIVVNNITVVNIASKSDFEKPVYRYKPPKGPAYKEPVYKPVKYVDIKEVVKYKATPEKPDYVKDVEIVRERPPIKNERLKEELGLKKEGEFGPERPSKPEFKEGKEVKKEEEVTFERPWNQRVGSKDKVLGREDLEKPIKPAGEGERRLGKDEEFKPERPVNPGLKDSRSLKVEDEDFAPKKREWLKEEKSLDREEVIRTRRPTVEEDKAFGREERYDGKSKTDLPFQLKFQREERTERPNFDKGATVFEDKKEAPKIRIREKVSVPDKKPSKKFEREENKEDNNKQSERGLER